MLWALCLYFFLVSIFMSASQTAATAGGLVIFYVAYFFALHFAKDEILRLFGENHILSVNILATIANVFTGGMQVFNALRRNVLDKKILLCFLPFCLISLPVGVVLLVSVNIQPLRFTLASFLLCVAIIQTILLWYKPPTKFRENLKQKHFIALCFTGVCSGFLQGAFGIGGPPRMLFMIWSNLCKTRARGAFLVSVYTLTIIKLVLLLIKGKVQFHSQQQFYILASIVLGAAPGIYVGNFVHAHIRPVQMSSFMIIMIVTGATMMFDPPTFVLEIVVGSLVFIIIGACIYAKRENLRKWLGLASSVQRTSSAVEPLAQKV